MLLCVVCVGEQDGSNKRKNEDEGGSLVMFPTRHSQHLSFLLLKTKIKTTFIIVTVLRPVFSYKGCRTFASLILVNLPVFWFSTCDS